MASRPKVLPAQAAPNGLGSTGGIVQKPPLAQSAKTIIAALVMLGGFGAGLRLLAEKLVTLMLYHPSRYTIFHNKLLLHFGELWKRRGYSIEEIHYDLDGIGPQRAIFLSPDAWATLNDSLKSQQQRQLWMFFGGNAMLATDWLSSGFCFELLSGQKTSASHTKVAMLLVDYPGYGANAGRPSPSTVLKGQHAALQALLVYLKTKHANGPAMAEIMLCLFGHSLGAAAASQFASIFRPKALSNLELRSVFPGRLVLSAPFTSIPAMAQSIFGTWLPMWLLRLLVAHRWDNDIWAPSAAAAGWDISIIHGSMDEIVPPRMGKALRDAVCHQSGKPCMFSEIEAAGHNDVTGYIETYIAAMGLCNQASPEGRNPSTRQNDMGNSKETMHRL